MCIGSVLIKGKNKDEYYVHNCLYTQNISESIFKMVKVVTYKENWVAEGQRREEPILL